MAASYQRTGKNETKLTLLILILYHSPTERERISHLQNAVCKRIDLLTKVKPKIEEKQIFSKP